MRMPTAYKMGRLKFYSAIAFVLVVSFFVLANTYNYCFSKKISVAENSYILKEGFPIFTSEEHYINFIKNYPYNPGTKLTIHKVRPGETVWTIKRRYGLSIHSIIAANPHLKDLEINSAKNLVIPSSNGSLVFFENFSDLEKIISEHNIAMDENRIAPYRPTILSLVKPHDMAMVFVERLRPHVVNDSIARLYKYMNYFSSPVQGGFYTSMFGMRTDPFRKDKEFHNGVDIAARMNSEIVSAKEGIVFFAGWKGGFGKTVIIQHADGYTSLYGHCNKLLVKKGDWVKQNQPIALLGSTGRSTGPHVHFTVFRHGEAINPISFIW